MNQVRLMYRKLSRALGCFRYHHRLLFSVMVLAVIVLAKEAAQSHIVKELLGYTWEATSTAAAGWVLFGEVE